MIVLRLLPLIYALLFILTRRIDVKVSKADELTVKISFNIFALLFTENKIKRARLKSITRIIKNARYNYKPISYLISKSNVVFSRYTHLQDDGTSLSVIKNAYTYASSQFLISYLSSTAKSFHLVEQEKFIQNKISNTVFDINIHFSLSHLIISAMLLLYYIVKNNLKKVMKNV